MWLAIVWGCLITLARLWINGALGFGGSLSPYTDDSLATARFELVDN
jgi:hypothetical protein